MLKKMILSISSLSLISLPIITTMNCAPIGVSFTGIGSNSVSPLIKEGTIAQTENPIAPYSYDNSGSGAGFYSQAHSSPRSDFGMTSSLKLPGTQDTSKYGSAETQINNWTRNHIRTVTWAVDAIALAVNLPNGLSTLGTPQIDSKELAKVYDGQNVAWEALLLNEDSASTSSSLQKSVIPIYITGGEATSGKSEAFINGVQRAAKDVTNKYSSNTQIISLKDGFEKHSSLTGHHGHADSFTDLLLDNNKSDGSIMYYSMGQIAAEMSTKNSQDHKNLSLAVAKGFTSDMSQAPIASDATSGKYTWTRSFNILYSVDNKKALRFAEYLLSAQFQDVVSKMFVKLPENNQEVKAQSQNLTTPDFQDGDIKGLFPKPTVLDAKNQKLGINI